METEDQLVVPAGRCCSHLKTDVAALTKAVQTISSDIRELASLFAARYGVAKRPSTCVFELNNIIIPFATWAMMSLFSDRLSDSVLNAKLVSGFTVLYSSLENFE
jgi:hypothetical protein